MHVSPAAIENAIRLLESGQIPSGRGVKWHFLPTERLWLNAELFKIDLRRTGCGNL